MTASPKSTIKQYFMTGDRPTEGQFSDLIDSYVDTLSVAGNIVSLASAGGTGVVNIISSSSATLQAAGVVGLQILAAVTTAQAQNIVSGTINLQTQVSGVLPIANGGTSGATAVSAFSALKQNATTTDTGVIEKATSAEVTSLTADRYADCSLMIRHPGVAKSVGSFDGTGGNGAKTLLDGYGASINKTGTGVYSVTLTNTMSSTNYIVIGGGTAANFIASVSSSTLFVIRTTDSSNNPSDSSYTRFSVLVLSQDDEESITYPVYGSFLPRHGPACGDE